MTVKMCAAAAAAILSLMSVSAYAEDKKDSESVSAPMLVADASRHLTTGIPTPTPRPSARAEEEYDKKIRRTEEGIRIVGVPFFPIR